MMKRAIRFLLCVIIAFCLLPADAAALAADSPYPLAEPGGGGAVQPEKRAVSHLYVDGHDLAGGGYFAADGASLEPGEDFTYHYDPASQTLTIQSAAITQPDGLGAQAAIYADGDLTLALMGGSEISGEMILTGIYVEGDLEIRSAGEGSLSISAQRGVCTLYDFSMTSGGLGIAGEGYGEGIFSEHGDAAVSGGEISITANMYGICATEGDIVFSGGKTTIAGNTGLAAFAGGVGIIDGEIAIDAINDGIFCDCGDVTIRGGILDIKADNCVSAYGGGITISGGLARLTAGGWGLGASGPIAVSGGELQVTAPAGLYSETGLRVDGGRVSVTGGEYGLLTKGRGEFRGGSVHIEANYGVCALTESEGLLFSGSSVAITAGTAGVYLESAGAEIAIIGGRIVIEPSEEPSGEVYYTFFSHSPIQVQNGMRITAGGQVKAVEIEGAVRYTIGTEDGISPRLVIEKPRPVVPPEVSSPAAPASSPERTIAVTETSSQLFLDSAAPILVEADMEDAFSHSVEVRVTDAQEGPASFGFGLWDKIYPFDISLYVKGTDNKTRPSPGFAVTVRLPVPDSLLEVKERLVILHLSEDGAVTELPSRLELTGGVWYIVFEASEFSPFALMVQYSRTYDASAGVPYYAGPEGGRTFIGLASRGRCIAPEGAEVFVARNEKSFSDTAGHWAQDAVAFVAERELFLGTGGGAFSPDAGMTRAMLATVIGRLYERSFCGIAPAAPAGFTDCDEASYYAKYVAWAAENKIIIGYGNGLFGPEDLVTREQLAAILYRFALNFGFLPGNMDIVLQYPDAESISDYAKTAALYCQSTGILSGRDGGLFVPKETATRAEVAAVLQRLIESILG